MMKRAKNWGTKSEQESTYFILNKKKIATINVAMSEQEQIKKGAKKMILRLFKSEGSKLTKFKNTNSSTCGKYKQKEI